MRPRGIRGDRRIIVGAMERYCSNCRTELPAGAEACPQCGVYAGELFDERSLRKRRAPRAGFWIALLVLASASYAGWIYWRSRPAPVPAAPQAVERKESEVARVRRTIIEATGVKDECLAVIRVRAGLYNAVNSCDGTKLGKWKVRGGRVVRG